MLDGLRDLFLRAIKCETCSEANRLVDLWNKEVESINKRFNLYYTGKQEVEAATADVAPVVHGHWIPKKEMIRSPEAKNYNCSACGKESFAYPNCPFCRAIMDEGVKEDAVH